MARDYEDPFSIRGLRPAGSAGIAGSPTRVRRPARTAPPAAGTRGHQDRIDSFNRRFGSRSPAAQATRNIIRDTTSMRGVVDAANASREANRQPGAVGYAAPNSITDGLSKTLNATPELIAASATKTPFTGNPGTYSTGVEVQESPLSAFGGPGPDVKPRLSDNVVSNTNERDPLEVSTAGVPYFNQPATPAAAAATPANITAPTPDERDPLSTSTETAPYPSTQSEQTEGLQRRKASSFRRDAQNLASQLYGRSSETRAAILQDMIDNDPEVAGLLADDMFMSIFQQYMQGS